MVRRVIRRSGGVGCKREKEKKIDEDSNQLFCGKGGGREKYLPSLHMCLSVPSGSRIIEL